jgi:hypothetical protein
MKIIAFHEPLRAAVRQLLEEEQMTCPATLEGLTQVILALADYREEGRALFPEILICDELSTALRIVQGQHPILMGDGPRHDSTLLRGLKVCAPLTQGGWAMYVERGGAVFQYGVFRLPIHPLSLSPIEALGDASPASVLMAMQRSTDVVEVRGTSGRGLQIHLAAASIAATGPIADLETLANTVTADLAKDEREDVGRFLVKTLSRSPRTGHGALAAVTTMPPEPALAMSTRPPLILRPCLDIAAALRDYKKALTVGPAVEELSAVQAASGLLHGMMSSDGITLFSTDAKVIACRLFVAPPVIAESSGGARRSAYASLCEAVGKHIAAAFFQSQDGRTACKRSP